MQGQGFVVVSGLRVGDKLLDYSGKTLIVEDVATETHREPVKVYDFQVEDFHICHVGTNGVLVHNAVCNMINTKMIKDNDLYFLEVIGDRIIINDNYEGVIILDKDFNELDKLRIFTDFVVDVSFKKADCIVICCYEKHCFVCVDVYTLEFQVIPFSSKMENMFFQNHYIWQEDILILMADNGSSIVQIDLKSFEIVLIKDTEMMEQSKAFKEFNNCLCYKTYADENCVLIESSSDIFLIDYQNGTRSFKGHHLRDFHDIEVFCEYVVQVSETKILISNTKGNIELFPSTPNYRFLRAKFVRHEGDPSLILLSCSNSNSQLAKLEKCKLKTYF